MRAHASGTNSNGVPEQTLKGYCCTVLPNPPLYFATSDRNWQHLGRGRVPDWLEALAAGSRDKSCL